MSNRNSGSYQYIREHQRIRKILELIYVYGFFLRDELSDFDINKNTYDKELRRMKDLYNELMFTRKRRVGFRRDSFSLPENRLVDSFHLKSYTDKEVKILLHTIIFLHKKQKGNIKDITAYIETMDPFSQEEDLYSTVRRTLNDLDALDILQKTKSGYLLQKNFLPDLSAEEFRELYPYICFSMRTTYPKVAGYLLKHSLDLIQSRSHWDLQDRYFVIRHTNYRNVLDEEMVYQILQSILERKALRFEIYSKSGKGFHKILPVLLKADRKMGRWFLFGIMDDLPAIVRLNQIKKLHSTKEIYDYDQAKASVTDHFQYSLISSGKTRKQPFVVKAKLLFSSNDGLKKQFLREMLIGEIAREGDAEIYSAFVHDPGELLPWLRSWGKFIEILPGEDGLRERLLGEIQEMISVYEDI